MNRASELQNQNVTAEASHTVGVVDHVNKFNLLSEKAHNWLRVTDGLKNTGLLSGVAGGIGFTAGVTGAAVGGVTVGVPLMATALVCFAASKIAETQWSKNFAKKAEIREERRLSHGEEGIEYESKVKNDRWLVKATAPPPSSKR